MFPHCRCMFVILEVIVCLWDVSSCSTLPGNIGMHSIESLLFFSMPKSNETCFYLDPFSRVSDTCKDRKKPLTGSLPVCRCPYPETGKMTDNTLNKKKSPFSTMIYTKKNGVAFHWKSFQLNSKEKKHVYWWNCFWVAKKTRSKRRWHRWAGWRSTIKCDIYHLLTTQTAYANGFIRICLLSVHVWFINANWLCF